MYEDYEDCAWTPDTPDACPYCSGEACAKCGPYYFGRPDCNCDSLERHRKPDMGMTHAMADSENAVDRLVGRLLVLAVLLAERHPEHHATVRSAITEIEALAKLRKLETPSPHGGRTEVAGRRCRSRVAAAPGRAESHDTLVELKLDEDTSATVSVRQTLLERLKVQTHLPSKATP